MYQSLINKIKNIFTINRIYKKFILVFGLVFLAYTASGLFSLRNANEIRSFLEIMYKDQYMSGIFAMSSKINFIKYEDNIKRSLLASSPEVASEFYKTALDFYNVFLGDIHTVFENITDQESKNIIDKIKNLSKEVSILNSELKNKSFEYINQFENNKNVVAIENFLENLTDIGIERGNALHISSKQITALLFKMTVISFLTTLMIIIFSTFYLERSILPHLKKLTNACVLITEGNYQKRAEIKSPCEFGTLGNTFNVMMFKIQTHDANMRSLLDGLSSAVFSFDNQGNIAEEKSKATDDIFPNFNQVSNINIFIKTFTTLKTETLEKLLTLTFDPKRTLPLSSALDLLPNKTTFLDDFGQEKHLVFNYQGVNRPQDETLEKIILIANDITVEVEAQKEKQIQEERIERITAVSKNQNSYQNFVNEANSLINNIKNHLVSNPSTESTNSKKISLDLHSLKGILALFNFNSCSSLVHGIEDLFKLFLSENNLEKINEILKLFNEMEDLFTIQKNDLENTLSISSNNKNLTSIYTPNLNQLITIISKTQNTQLQNALFELYKFPLSEVFKKYELHLTRLKKKFPDKSARIVYDSASDQIAYSEIESLDGAFIHLINNCFDHGIEEEYLRTSNNKPAEGTIKISLQRKISTSASSVSSLIFTLQDDGKGIDPSLLARKAVEKGIWNEDKLNNSTDEEKIALIFEPSFSSKDEVSAISGRGIGMSAVREDITKINGNLQVHSIINQGTTFIIEVPSNKTLFS